LAVYGEAGYPYVVPLNYVYDNQKFIHNALSGHKLDAIKRNSKIFFCVIKKEQVATEECTTYYRSIFTLETVKILESQSEKRATPEVLAV